MRHGKGPALHELWKSTAGAELAQQNFMKDRESRELLRKLNDPTREHLRQRGQSELTVLFTVRKVPRRLVASVMHLSFKDHNEGRIILEENRFKPTRFLKKMQHQADIFHNHPNLSEEEEPPFLPRV